MKRLHSFVVWEGEARTQAVSPHFDFSHPSGDEEEEGSTLQLRCGWLEIFLSLVLPQFCFWILSADVVGSWAEQKEPPSTSSLSVLLSQARISWFSTVFWDMKENKLSLGGLHRWRCSCWVISYWNSVLPEKSERKNYWPVNLRRKTVLVKLSRFLAHFSPGDKVIILKEKLFNSLNFEIKQLWFSILLNICSSPWSTKPVTYN